MHGGAIATLFDFCTSAVLALVSRPGYYHYWGVTRTLSTAYLRPVPAGTALLVECEAVAVGRQMAHLRGVLRGAAPGKEGGRGVVYAVWYVLHSFFFGWGVGHGVVELLAPSPPAGEKSKVYLGICWLMHLHSEHGKVNMDGQVKAGAMEGQRLVETGRGKL